MKYSYGHVFRYFKVRTIKIALLGVTIATLTISCSDGGGTANGTSLPVGKANGIWGGTISSSVSGEASEIFGLTHEGEVRFVLPDWSRSHVGTYQLTESSFMSQGTVYGVGSGVGVPYYSTKLNGSFEEISSISGIYSSNDIHAPDVEVDSGTYSLTYNPVYERASSMSFVEGIWSYTGPNISDVTTISVGSDGTFTGTDYMGCYMSGAISLINESINLYSVSYERPSCIIAGTYSGYAYLYDGLSTNDKMFWSVDKEGYLESARFDRQ